MLKKILSISALTFLGLVSATKSNGACKAVKLQENFDATKYMGTWFEQARDKGMIFEKFDCSQAHYTLNADGSIAVLNTEFNPTSGQVEKATASAKCNGPLCKVYFVPFAGGDYEVLATDYDNYAFVYSCEDSFFGGKSEMVWILTRDQQLKPEIEQLRKQIMAERIPDYKEENFRITKQSESCQYLQ